MKRLDEGGEKALLQLQEPVNKFPEFVATILRQLKSLFPGMGKVKIAQVLARAGLHLGVTTVGRMLKRPIKNVEQEINLSEDLETEKVRIVTAKYPGHVFHLDLTVVPTSRGFWVPWLHQSWPQVWPFCWWVGWIVDHYSRYVIGFAVFKKKPTTKEVRSFLGRAFRKAKIKPKHIIMDKDKPFDCDAFKEWCRRRDIHPRYGAIGKYGSLAVVERFIRSMKQESVRRILVPFRRDAIRRELVFYAAWFNEFRPHTYLSGKTPKEVYKGLVPANTKARYEPRSRWPRGSPCAEPQTIIKGKKGANPVIAYSF